MSTVIRDELIALFATRKRFGLYAEVGRHVGVSGQSVSEWASGTTEPSAQYWPALETYFNLPTGHFAKLASTGSRLTTPTATAPTPPVERTRPSIDAAVQRLNEIAEQLAAEHDRVAQMLDQQAQRIAELERRDDPPDPPTPTPRRSQRRSN